MNTKIKELKASLRDQSASETELTNDSILRTNTLVTGFNSLESELTEQQLTDFVTSVESESTEFAFGDTNPLFNAIEASTAMSSTAKATLISLLEDGVGGRPNDRGR